MEPNRQIEIQLGHMCNNRCVFCVSGQRTAMREAFPLEEAPILERVRQAHASGLRKITILGGEPTLQPSFLSVVGEASRLGFDEIVVFTNGVKTARAEVIDEVLATGGNFTWRLSFQGGTALAHERTTRKLGSFRRLVETMGHLRDRRQRITVNMCVVQSNFESVENFAALLLPFGAQQLHLDMVRPMDAGERTEEEMRAMIPRYGAMVPHLERMVAAFPRGFDVNVGNLPYCIAPTLAPWIHHDGESTLTIAVDGDDGLSDAWDKYEVKRRDKVKPEACRQCVFDAQCSGVFETYARFYGFEELRPIRWSELAALDPTIELFALHLEPLLRQVRTWRSASGFTLVSEHVDGRSGLATLVFGRETGANVDVVLQRPGAGVAGTDRFSVSVRSTATIDGRARELVRDLLELACGELGFERAHPVADDFDWQIRGKADKRLDARIGQGLRLLRAAAPFRPLAWTRADIDADGRGARVTLQADDGTTVVVRMALRGESVACGYELDRAVDRVAPSVVSALRRAVLSLRNEARGSEPTTSGLAARAP